MSYEKPDYPRRQLTREEEQERDALYLKLGRAYYEGAYEDPLPQLLPIFDQLTELMKEPEPEMEVCPVCGAEVPEGAVFCEECGTAIRAKAPAAPELPPEPRRCPNCGNELREGARFCGKCGEKVC